MTERWPPGETDQTEDVRIWRLTSGGSNFFIQVLNDAGTEVQQVFVKPRDGVDVESVRLLTEGTIAIYVHAGQNVEIVQSDPATRLHAETPVHVGRFASANPPSASGVETGTIAFATYAHDRVQLTYSDCTDWR